MTKDNHKFTTEVVDISLLKPHPKNYRQHPEDQLEHIIESIKENGIYRNIVVAEDNVILAGHGVVEALQAMGTNSVPIIRLPVKSDDPRALKILAGDNEISHLGIIDDRGLTEILKEIREFDPMGLLGTGFDDQMLANLVFITRPKSEIESFDEAAHWVGMPEHEPVDPWPKITVNFENDEAKIDFARQLGIEITDKTKSIWWPPKERDDITAVRFAEQAS